MKFEKLMANTFAISLLLLPSLAMAASGLAAGTNMLTTIRVWGYSALGVGCSIYMIYRVANCLLERDQWGSVAVGLGHCAIAGGVVAAADAAWAVWGS